MASELPVSCTQYVEQKSNSDSSEFTKWKLWKHTYSVVGQGSRYSHSLQAGWSGNRIPVGGEIFCPHPDQPWGPPNLLYIGYQVFPRGKVARAWHWPFTPIYCWG